MPLKSSLPSLALLLCATVVCCQVHVSFAPRQKPDAAQIAQADVAAPASTNQAAEEKKSRFSLFDFNRNKQKLVDQQPLKKYLSKNQRQKSREQSTVTQQVAAASSKPIHAPREETEPQHKLVGHTVEEPAHIVQQAQQVSPPAAEAEPVVSAEESTVPGSSSFPINLPTALRLAGAESWNVQLAEERITEAYARHEKAKVMWIPSLNAGIGYTKHDGQIQATNGQVIDVSRNSLFVGGGAITSGAPPLTGGAGGPARLALDLSLTNAIFEPLAERQLYNAARSSHSAAFNNTLLEASLGYYDLVKAQGALAIATQNLKNAEELFSLTESFVKAGKGSRADVSRAAVEVSRRKQAIIKAELAMKVASTNLIRILQLDPEEIGAQTLLVALEEQPLPVALIQESSSLPELIEQGHVSRPELSEQASRMEASRVRARAELWRPYLPNLHMGSSFGAFGGGRNGQLNQLDGRSDVDLLAVWQIENLGFGTRARRRQMNSQFRQNVLSTNRTFDIVSADVTNNWHTVHAQREQIQLAEENIQRASESYDQNIARIRGLAGLPLEGLQALSAVAGARQTYLNAIIGYNQSQLNLLRAIGRPPGMEE